MIVIIIQIITKITTPLLRRRIMTTKMVAAIMVFILSSPGALKTQPNGFGKVAGLSAV